MEIKKAVVGYLEENCYILVKDKTCIVIDPGDEVNLIEEEIKDNELVGIIITHRHPDHIGALNDLLKKHNVNVYDITNLKEGKNKIGEFSFNILYTKGHTNDSITVIFDDEKLMFTGDFLFKDTIGRTDLPTGNMKEMEESIKKIKEYEDFYLIYPGHGASTNLGYEKNNNIFFN